MKPRGWISTQMVFECGRMQKVSGGGISWYTVRKMFGSIRNNIFDHQPDLDEDFLYIRRKACDVLVHAGKCLPFLFY